MIKFTKNELRDQQTRLAQLQRYLPTLQLKKAMLQTEVYEARQEALQYRAEEKKVAAQVAKMGHLFSESAPLALDQIAQIERVDKHYENIAGVELPFFDGVSFKPLEYALFDTPPWLEAFAAQARGHAEAAVHVEIAEEKQAALEEELRQVSIRVNLFEKVLIPRALGNIKRIKVFLGDQQLAAVAQAKVAKAKIVERHSHAR
ncbi:MAG: V-type ATP synthase subunit D [Parachlamydiales bacterium]